MKQTDSIRQQSRAFADGYYYLFKVTLWVKSLRPIDLIIVWLKVRQSQQQSMVFSFLNSPKKCSELVKRACSFNRDLGVCMFLCTRIEVENIVFIWKLFGIFKTSLVLFHSMHFCKHVNRLKYCILRYVSEIRKKNGLKYRK